MAPSLKQLWGAFTGFDHENMRSILNNAVGTLPDSKMTRVLKTPDANALIFTTASFAVDFDFEERGSCAYKPFFIGAKASVWGYWNKQWKQMFVPIFVSWGPKRNREYDGSYSKCRVVRHIALLYFERSNEGVTKSVYFDNLSLAEPKNECGVFHEDFSRFQKLIRHVKSQLNIPESTTTWHPVAPFNQGDTPNCCSIYMLHCILSLLESGTYTKEAIDGEKPKNLGKLLGERLRKFNTML